MPRWLAAELAPALVVTKGIGTEIDGCLLVTAGGHPDALRSEAGFAMLCGVAPIPASSGKTERHRLNRGGDRRANSALHTAAVRWMREDGRTPTACVASPRSSRNGRLSGA